MSASALVRTVVHSQSMMVLAVFMTACSSNAAAAPDEELAECLVGVWVSEDGQACRCEPEIFRTSECDQADCLSHEIIAVDATLSGIQFGANLSSELGELSVPGGAATVSSFTGFVSEGVLVRTFDASGIPLEQRVGSCDAERLTLDRARPYEAASPSLAAAVRTAGASDRFTMLSF